MAIIQDGSLVSGWAIDPTSLSGKVRLVNADGTPLSKATNDASSANDEAMIIGGVNDENYLPMRVDRLGSVGNAAFVPAFFDSFEGATVSPDRYLSTATTMAATQASATGIVINSGAITTINTGYMLQSARRFLKQSKAPLFGRFRARMVHFANAVMELGFHDASTFNGAITNGAYFQITTSGTLQPVVAFNGAFTSGASISFNNANYYIFDIWMDDDSVTFTVQDSSTGLIISRQVLTLSLTAPRFLAATGVPSAARVFNSGSAPATAPQMIVTDIAVGYLDQTVALSAQYMAAMASRGGLANPATGAQLATFANSAEPASATLSNTAAGYTTLGGKFQFAAPAGAATDFALFGFQVPAPFNLCVTGVSIDVWNTVVASATTPTLMQWFAAANSTAVSLATATGMRLPIGAHSMPVGTAPGGLAGPQVTRQFTTPLIVNSGRFFHLGLRVPVGTATATQVIAGMAAIEGFFF